MIRHGLRQRILVCAVGFLAGLPAWGQSQTSVVSVLDFGARPDGTDPARTTAAFLRAFAVNPTGEIVVPPGEYLLDNGVGAIVVNNFAGLLSFKGAARIAFTDNTRGGLWFEGGAGARIDGLRATYQTAAVQRHSPEEQIKFSDTADTSVSDLQVSGSPSAGLLFYNCVRPKVSNAVIRNTQGDGLHFANCQDAQASNITTENTGDDGLAFLNYSGYPDKSGGTAYNIVVRNSGSRGISVVGQSNVVVSNFRVDGTASSGILCAYDPSYRTRVPANVRFSSGTVNAAGTGPNPKGNNYGIEFNQQTSCSFSDIAVTGSAGRGLAGSSASGAVTVSNVQVSGNKDGEAFSFVKTARVTITGSGSDTTPGYAFFFGQCGAVVAKALLARNSAQTGYLHRAFWFESNQTLAASDLTVIDTQPQATGYILGTYDANSATQSGAVNGVTAHIAGGVMTLQNESRNVRIVNVSQ